jgi:hypothetical protein
MFSKVDKLGNNSATRITRGNIVRFLGSEQMGIHSWKLSSKFSNVHTIKLPGSVPAQYKDSQTITLDTLSTICNGDNDF